jgi:hypothetical protein
MDKLPPWTGVPTTSHNLAIAVAAVNTSSTGYPRWLLRPEASVRAGARTRHFEGADVCRRRLATANGVR